MMFPLSAILNHLRLRRTIIPFDTIVESLSPVAWYKFQDANFNTGTNLTDSSGYGRTLARYGASAIPDGPALRTTTAKCGNLTSSRTDFWEDTGGSLQNFASGASAVSFIWSVQKTSLSNFFTKVLGWRNGNDSNILAVDQQWTVGTNFDFVISDTAGTDYGYAQTNADLNTHVYGLTFGNSVVNIWKDNVRTVTDQNIGSANLYVNGGDGGRKFTMGGQTSGTTSSAPFMTDHFSLYNYTLSPAEMNSAMLAYLSEKL